MNKFLLSAAIFLALSSCVFGNPAAGPIVPGKSAGKLELGMSHEEMSKILGTPVASRKHPHGYDIAVWFHHEEDEPEDTTQVVYASDKAVQIEVISADFVAPDSLTTKNSLGQVIWRNKNLSLQAYVDPEDGNSVYIYDDVKTGISFIIWPDDHFTHARKIDCISVHRQNIPSILPIDTKRVTPTLNQPRKPTPLTKDGIPTSLAKIFSPTGLPLTEHLDAAGARGFASKPVYFKGDVAFFGMVMNSYQGKKLTQPQCFLIFLSYSE